MPLASKYVWWKTPDEAVAFPERVIAQVMNIGGYADGVALAVAGGNHRPSVDFDFFGEA